MRESLVRYEQMLDWLIDHLRGAESEGRLVQFLADFSSPEQAKAILDRAGNLEGLVKYEEDARPLLRKCADLMLLLPAECDDVYKERYEGKLKANPIAALIAPDYAEERREDAQSDCRRAMLRAAIDVVDRGKAALADHPDPYGHGPFEYVTFEGGFELRSALVHHVQINLVVGVRKN
jgi:hypothetical protein